MARPFPGPFRRRFATTRWSRVRAAGGGPSQQAKRALAELCASYWSPLYCFYRRIGRPPEEALDLTQDFIAYLIHDNVLAHADPSRGRFRSWLLAVAKHRLANLTKREQAQKRGGDLVRLDASEAERCFGALAAPVQTPEEAYEQRWVMSLLVRARRTLRDEYRSRGLERLFERLEPELAGGETDPHARPAQELGMTVGAVKTAAARLRDRHYVRVRAEVALTVERPEEIEEEMQYLRSVLRRR